MTGSLGGRVLVVSYRVDKGAVGKLIVLAILFSVVLGVILGSLTSNIVLGFSVFAGMGTLANAVIGVLVWISR